MASDAGEGVGTRLKGEEKYAGGAAEVERLRQMICNVKVCWETNRVK